MWLAFFALLGVWVVSVFFFFVNDTATTEIYTLSLHDALPISASRLGSRLIVTCGTGEVAVISAVPGAAEVPGVIPVSQVLIFAALGRNTTCPRVTVADGTVTPSAVW